MQRDIFISRYAPTNLPASIEGAEERVEEVVQQIQSIDAQLRNRERINPHTGEEWSREEYNDWRLRAMRAKMYATKELRFLKRWVRQERTRYNAKAINVDFDNPKSLIHAAYVLLCSLIKQGIEFTDEERELVDILDKYLQHK